MVLVAFILHPRNNIIGDQPLQLLRATDSTDSYILNILVAGLLLACFPKARIASTYASVVNLSLWQLAWKTSIGRSKSERWEKCCTKGPCRDCSKILSRTTVGIE